MDRDHPLSLVLGGLLDEEVDDVEELGGNTKENLLNHFALKWPAIIFVYLLRVRV